MKKTTYIALLVKEYSNNVVKFSDFKSVEDFKKFLQDNHLAYDAGEGNFISTFLPIGELINHIND